MQEMLDILRILYVAMVNTIPTQVCGLLYYLLEAPPRQHIC